MKRNLRIKMDFNWQGVPTFQSLRTMLMQAYNIRFGSVLPGGMSSASFTIPWRRGWALPNVQRAGVTIYDGISPVWFGRVNNITDAIQGGARTLVVDAQGPWADAARTPFTQRYDGTSGTGNSWSIYEAIQAAVFGNLPDVIPTTDDWTAPANLLGDITWTDSTVQNVISECLRIGDSSTAPWSFVIDPPIRRYTNANVFARIGGLTVEDTASGFTDEGTIYEASVPRHRPMTGKGGSMLLAAPSGGSAYIQFGPSDVSEAEVAAWFYIPKYIYENWNLYHFQMGSVAPGFAEIVKVWSTVTAATVGRLNLYNDDTAQTFQSTATTAIGQGCWHHLRLHTKVHATTGYHNLYLDGVCVIATGNIDTNLGAIHYINVGISDAAASARMYYLDTISATVGSETLGMTDFINADGTVGCKPRLFKLSLPTVTDKPDFWIDQDLISGDFKITNSSDDMMNLMIVKGATYYAVLDVDDDSAQRYGPLQKYVSATRLKEGASPNQVDNLSGRLLAQKASPQNKLQSFTLRTAPAGRFGAPFPLTQIRAGKTFRVRNQPKLGLQYVGQAEFQQGSGGEPDTCTITPNEPALDLAGVIALREERAWT